MEYKSLLKLVVASVLFLGMAPATLYGQSPAIPASEIPEPSGGSGSDSYLSSEGVLLGPDPLLGATPDVEPLVTDNSTIGNTFEGFGYDDNGPLNGFSAIPPDAHGAAGPDRVIAVVNRMIEARTKSGTLLFRASLRGFFTTEVTPGTSDFDPKVIYDHFEDRFLVVALERFEQSSSPDPLNLSRILVAVSKTSSPASATTADWHYHTINSKETILGNDHWADYPGFEVDEEAVYITNNMFRHVNRSFGGVRLWIIDKGVAGGFYAGGTATVTLRDPYASAPGNAVTTMPAQVYGAGGIGPGIGTFLVSHNGFTNGVDEFVQVVRVNNPLGAVSFTLETVNVGNIDDIPLGGLPNAPQSGTAMLIEVNDRRALDAVWRDDGLWLTTTILPNSGPDAGQTTAHWFRLDTSSVVSSASPANQITLADQGDIGGEDIAPGTYTFFPSVAVNSAGDAKFGFSASAPTIFGGAFVTGRRTGDPAGTVRASATVHAGEDSYFRIFSGTRNRWGDYSGISLDPSDDNIFWVFNQYADTRGSESGGQDGRWGTAWASCSFGPIGILAVKPSKTFKPKGRAGGPFKPKKKKYKVTNSGTGPLSWQARDNKRWLKVKPSSGALNAGQSISVKVQLKRRPVNRLKAKKRPYKGKVSFTNATNRIGDTERRVKLKVRR